jgi:urease subunit gamma/beta
MHLTVREQERLVIFQLAELARRRLARGSRLSAPEAIAVVCDELLEMAWDGVALQDVVAAGPQVLRRDQLMPGVAEAVPQIQVEALFPQGTALVAVEWPFGMPGDHGPGAVEPAEGGVELNQGRPVLTLRVRNTADRPVFVSSHFPFAEVNSSLEFDRARTAGMRLNIPAGTSETFPPGSVHDVELVPNHRPAAPPEEVTADVPRP